MGAHTPSMPALLKARSSPPYSLIACLTNASISAATRTSVRWKLAVPPASRIIETVSSRPAGFPRPSTPPRMWIALAVMFTGRLTDLGIIGGVLPIGP